MKISGCYIVKNEEENLKRSVESIIAVCDEIIVVDTGSTDSTVDIAKELGCQVHHFNWVNNFSTARNFALSQASGDVVIFLDADEWFVPALDQNHKALMKEKFDLGHDVLYIPLQDIMDDGSPFAPMPAARIFRTDRGIRYAKAIHEALGSITNPFTFTEQFFAHHTGYQKGLLRLKMQRNLEIILSEIKRENNRERRRPLYYYAARESATLGMVEEAFGYLGSYFRGFTASAEFDPIPMAAHALRCELSVGNPHELYSNAACKSYIEAMKRDFPNHPVTTFCEGSYYYQREGDYLSAKACFSRFDQLAKEYSIDQFIGDITQPQAYETRFLLMWALTDYYLGDHLSALDSFVRLTQKEPRDTYYRHLLHIIKHQPEEEIVAFLNAVSQGAGPEVIELILSQLLYFPKLKGVYMYYAMEHMRQTKSNSYMSALVSLYQDRDLNAAFSVSQSLRNVNNLKAADVLLCTALFYAGGSEVKSFAPEGWHMKDVMDCYFAGRPIGKFSLTQLTTMNDIVKIILFLDDPDVTARVFRLFDETKYDRFVMTYNYRIAAEQFEAVIDSIDFNMYELDDQNMCNCFIALAKAYTGVKDYRRAYENLSSYITLAPDNTDAYVELRKLACLNPQIEDVVQRTIQTAKVLNTPGKYDEARAKR